MAVTSSAPVVIRAAGARDAEACREIYAPHVLERSTSFELEVPSIDEMAHRIAAASERHCWLVAVDEADSPIGYAYGTSFRARKAYRFGTETSVYVADGAQRQGLGRSLYERLFDELKGLGYCHAYAGITLPNDPSVALHERLRFVSIGRFPSAGFKFDRWHDVGWWYRVLHGGQPIDRSP